MFTAAEPKAPRNLTVAELQHDKLTVTWEAPEFDGGAPITQYVISTREEGTTKFKKAGTTDGNSFSFTVQNSLEKGRKYDVKVLAENAVGVSKDAAELPQGITIPEEPKEAVEEDIEADEIKNQKKAPAKVKDVGGFQTVPAFVDTIASTDTTNPGLIYQRFSCRNRRRLHRKKSRKRLQRPWRKTLRRRLMPKRPLGLQSLWLLPAWIGLIYH